MGKLLIWFGLVGGSRGGSSTKIGLSLTHSTLEETKMAQYYIGRASEHGAYIRTSEKATIEEARALTARDGLPRPVVQIVAWVTVDTTEPVVRPTKVKWMTWGLQSSSKP